jgi:tetratricopeptide (TPR) repeat protein
MKLFSILIMTFLLAVSCTREQEKTTVPNSEEKNIFEEVKGQTLSNPNDAEAWYHLADLYERSGLYQEEIAALKKVTALAPKNGNAYSKLGNAYNRLGQYDEAINNFKIAIKFSPKNPVLYNNLAVSYGKTNKTDQEIAALEHAISLRPRYATARFNLGIAMLKKGKRDLAQKQYQELLKFDDGVAQSLKKEIDAQRK